MLYLMHVTVWGLPAKQCGVSKSALAGDIAEALHRIDVLKLNHDTDDARVWTDFPVPDDPSGGMIYRVIAEVSAIVDQDDISDVLRAQIGKVVKQTLLKHMKGAACVPPCPVGVPRVDLIAEDEPGSLHDFNFL